MRHWLLKSLLLRCKHGMPKAVAARCVFAAVISQKVRHGLVESAKENRVITFPCITQKAPKGHLLATVTNNAQGRSPATRSAASQTSVCCQFACCSSGFILIIIHWRRHGDGAFITDKFSKILFSVLIIKSIMFTKE